MATTDGSLAVSVADAARMLAVSEDTIYRLLDQGDLPELPRWSKRRLIPRQAIEAVVAQALAEFDARRTLGRLQEVG